MLVIIFTIGNMEKFINMFTLTDHFQKFPFLNTCIQDHTPGMEMKILLVLPVIDMLKKKIIQGM